VLVPVAVPVPALPEVPPPVVLLVPLVVPQSEPDVPLLELVPEVPVELPLVPELVPEVPLPLLVPEVEPVVSVLVPAPVLTAAA
jgi:hypothetical protein